VVVWLFDHSNDSYRSIVLDFRKILEHSRINSRCQTYILISELLAPLSYMINTGQTCPTSHSTDSGGDKKYHHSGIREKLQCKHTMTNFNSFTITKWWFSWEHCPMCFNKEILRGCFTSWSSHVEVQRAAEITFGHPMVYKRI
jgi:hypothetical protein